MSGRRGLTSAGRVAIAVVVVLGIGVVAVAAVAYAGTITRIAAELDAALVREVEAYDAAVTPRGTTDARSLEGASRTYLQARESSGGLDALLLVRFPDGRVLSNSEVRLEDAPGNEVLLDPETTRAGFSTLEVDGERLRVATSPVTNAQGEVLGVFQAAFATGESELIARQLALTLLLAGAAVVLVGAAISARVARASLTPLRDMAATAAQITHSSMDERIDYSGPDEELRVLGDSIDSMLDRIETAFAEQRRFVADASHELRTPLAVIRGNLDILDGDTLTLDDRAEALHVINDEVDRMGRLLTDLLALAGTETATRRPFQPLQAALLLNETAGRLASIAPNRFELICAEEAWVMGDPDLLEQVLLNLARNAIQHTPDDGRIRMSCRRTETQDQPTVTITIADSGPGIGPDDLPHVFDRFYRASGPRGADSGGSGLGLAIARRLVELHDGTIEASNASEGTGAVFTITLPRIPTPKDASLDGAVG